MNNSSAAMNTGTDQWRTIVRSLIDTHNEPIIVAASTLQIEIANRAAHDAFGRTAEPFEHRRLTEVLRYPELHKAFTECVEEKERAAVRLETIGSNRRIYDVSLAPLVAGNGLFGVGVFRDITKVERLEKVRQEFLANISHELRTPLAAILALVETLEDGAIDDTEINRRFLEKIRRNSQKMQALINDILELSFVESGKTSLERSHVKPGRIVDEIFTTLAARAEENDVSLINAVDADRTVFADPVRLEQMLTNLIDNAVKFNRRGGSVTVRISGENGRDIIEVADTGDGISAEHINRIFERFYRGDRSRARRIGGTGLGLSIVKHLARLHGGEAYVSSKLGTGTVFSIELPRKPVA
jgi:two-component system phosphate regulon sensor histidine kinase PhoR